MGFQDNFNPMTTIAVSIAGLVLGIPVAVAAIIFENVYMPNIVLGSKTINTGLGTTKTIDFSLLSGPNDAVIAAAYISIVGSILFVAGLWLVRHVSKHNIWGWAMVGPAVLNVLGQIACLAYVFIVQGLHPEATSTEDVKYVDGKYDTNGKLYTRETWACMMEKFYSEREGEWAGKACSDMKTGRLLTIPLVACATVLVAIAFWQVQRKGGFGWLFGRRSRIAAMKQQKGDYIDLQG